MPSTSERTLTVAVTPDDDVTLSTNKKLTFPANQTASTGVVTITGVANTDDHPDTRTVSVSAAAVAPAVAGDFTLSSNKRLTIAKGETASTGVVTITAVTNDDDNPDRSVTVSAMASGDNGIAAPAGRDADDHGRRPAQGDAGADARFHIGGRRHQHGHGEAELGRHQSDHALGVRHARQPPPPS